MAAGDVLVVTRPPGAGKSTVAEHLAHLLASVRFAFLNRIQTAVRPEIRTRRIGQLTDALAQGKTPYPAPKNKPGP